MAEALAQALTRPSGTHLVLYDGVCGLCNRLLQFLFKHDRRAAFCYASLQSPLGKATVEQWGGNPDDLNSFYVVADFRTPQARVFVRGDAAVFVAGELDWPWKVTRVARFIPRPFRNRVYDAIARSRYRIFGRYDQCPIPSEAMKRRFAE